MAAVNFQPTGDVSRAFFEDRHNDVQLIRGPIGSGKTTTCMIKLLMMAQEMPPNEDGERISRWFIVRQTYEDLKKTTFNDWTEQWRRLLPWRSPTQSPMRDKFLYSLPDNTTVRVQFDFVALDQPDDIERVRGANYTGGWCNELKQLELGHLEVLMGRCGRYPSEAQGGMICPPELAVVLGDTNSPDDDHWLHKKEVEDRPLGWGFYVQPPAVVEVPAHECELIKVDFGRGQVEHRHYLKSDNSVEVIKGYRVNPDAENIQNLQPGYYEKQLRTFAKDRIRADLCNVFTHLQEGRPVHPEYDDIRNCSQGVVFDPRLPLLIGADGGLTPAVVIGQLSPAGQLRLIEEIQGEGGVFQFWRDIVKPILAVKYRNAEVAYAFFDPSGDNRGEGMGLSAIGLLNDLYYRHPDDDAGGFDPEEALFIVHERLSLPFTVEPAPTNDITLRLDSVKTFLRRDINGAPGLALSDQCPILRSGFNGKYYYRKVAVKGAARYQDKPDKGKHSHMHNALEYLALGCTSGTVHQMMNHPPPREPRKRHSRTGY